MRQSLEESLTKLQNAAVAIFGNDIPDTEGQASIVVQFADGTVLKATYWRVTQNGKAQFSSFDHRQKYGLPAPVDAKTQLINLLHGKICLSAHVDKETADLVLIFADFTKLQIFNFTGYEIWEILFPNGTGEYSNYALRD